MAARRYKRFRLEESVQTRKRKGQWNGLGQLVLGTAQLGQPYGATNRSGKPSEAAAVALVRAAVNAGVQQIDTARAYGDAERRIGLCGSDLAEMAIVTKLDPLAAIPADASEDRLRAAAEASLAASRAALGRERLNTVLLHRASHRTQWGGSVWRLLAREREGGSIEALGVSVQTPTELLEALQDPLVTHVQLPFNVLDRRWAAAGAIEALCNRPDVSVHVRSVFLQGLLAGGTEACWPAIEGVDPPAIIERLDRLASETGRDGRADLCIAHARSQHWIDGIVVGMETVEQLIANLALFRRNPLSDKARETVSAAVPPVPATLLDPAKWSIENRSKPPRATLCP